MRNLNPLGYAAMVCVLMFVLAFSMFHMGRATMASALRRQGWVLIGVPLQVLYWCAGKLMVLVTTAAKGIVWMVHAMAYTWVPPLAPWVGSLSHALACYRRSQFHQAAHAA